jgi:hypothetical protein
VHLSSTEQRGYNETFNVQLIGCALKAHKQWDSGDYDTTFHFAKTWPVRYHAQEDCYFIALLCSEADQRSTDEQPGKNLRATAECLRWTKASLTDKPTDWPQRLYTETSALHRDVFARYCCSIHLKANVSDVPTITSSVVVFDKQCRAHGGNKRRKTRPKSGTGL